MWLIVFTSYLVLKTIVKLDIKRRRADKQREQLTGVPICMISKVDCATDGSYTETGVGAA